MHTKSRQPSSRLVIVPCGRSKIWNKHPNAGPTPAKDAYTGTPFKLNRRYAETFGDAWLILSAKYGFISPDFVLLGPYEVTFKRKSSAPVSTDVLRHQVVDQRLSDFAFIIGLGGKEYRAAIESAFHQTAAELQFPFAGLPIGKSMQATKRAIEKPRTATDLQ